MNFFYEKISRQFPHVRTEETVEGGFNCFANIRNKTLDCSKKFLNFLSSAAFAMLLKSVLKRG